VSAAPATHVYRTYAEARAGIRELEASGVDGRSISVLTRSPSDAETLEHDTGASDDLEGVAVERHRLGDLLDWLGRVESAAVPGFGAMLGTGDLWRDIAVTQAGHGSITGALVSIGVPVDHAAELENAVDNGQILVVVHPRNH
jgi:Heat induced stress protein YflT